MSDNDKVNDAARRDFIRRQGGSPSAVEDLAKKMERYFKSTFLIDDEDPLHPPPFSTTQPLSSEVRISLMLKVKSRIDGDDIHMADAPHTCARCALKFVHHDFTMLPCI